MDAFVRPNLLSGSPILSSSKHLLPGNPANTLWLFRNFSYGSVNFVLAEGKPKFETHEVDPPKKEKWTNKKRFKLQKKREKQKRKAANKKDPRRIGKNRKQKFANAEERIKYKLDKVSCHNSVLFLALYLLWLYFVASISKVGCFMLLDNQLEIPCQLKLLTLIWTRD